MPFCQVIHPCKKEKKGYILQREYQHREFIMKPFFYLLTFTLSTILAAVEPFRAPTALEQKLFPAKAEFYRNYDQLEAHFKFANALYEAGCLESAFRNAEVLLKNDISTKAKEFFDRHAKRKLVELLTGKERELLAKLPPPEQLKQINHLLQNKAAANPICMEYLRFSGNPEKWNSRHPKDIAFVKQQISQASASGKLDHLLEYNSAAANYLYLAAKDYENALPFFIRLYFHDPEYATSLQSPLGFIINHILQITTPLRCNRAEVISRRDPVKLIIDNMHIQPRTVQNFLQRTKKELSPEKFVKLCLLASDSVDLQLRSFVFGELMHRDLSPLLPLLKQLLADDDAGRRAVAVLILPFGIPAGKLPEALAEMNKDKSAVVRMTVEIVARNRCSADGYTRFKSLIVQ